MLTVAPPSGHRIIRQLAVALSLVFLFRPQVLDAASGDLDPTFGADGMAISGMSEDEEATAVVVLPDGGLVVAGNVFAGNEWHFMIQRYRGDGSPDASSWDTSVVVADIGDLDLANGVDVHTDGTVLAVGQTCSPTCQFGLVWVFPDGGSPGPVTTSFGAGDAYATAVKFQPDGKALAAGYWSTPNGDHDIGIARYLPDGSLDPDFGLGGKVTTGSSPGSAEAAFALALQPDGRILVSGDRCIAGTCEFLLLRYLADGSPDLSFGVNGIVTTPIGSAGGGSAADIAVQADGRIVAAGNARGVDYDFAVARYESDGTLDVTFGTGGKVTTSVDDGEDTAQGLTIDEASGTITLAGYACNGPACPGSMMALVRYRSDGSLDPSFGTGGIVTTAIGSDAGAAGVTLLPGGRTVVVGTALNEATYDLALVGYRSDGGLDLGFGGGTVTSGFTTEDIPYAVGIQEDGKILVAGTGTNPGSPVVEVARYEADGTIDSTFGAGGVTMTTLVSAPDSSLGLVLQPDGKAVVAGSSAIAPEFSLVRYDQAGILDANFGIGGLATANFGADSAYARTVARQPDGKLVVAGSVQISGVGEFALARHNADGSLDTNFGLGGKVVTSLSATNSGIRAIAVQSDGKIVATGYAEAPSGPFTNSSHFALARYNAEGNLDPSFGSDGIVMTAIVEAGSAESNAVVLEPGGKIVVAGWADAGVIMFALARYLSDGSLDPEFGSGGIVTTQAGGYESSLYGLALDDSGRIIAVGAAGNANDQDMGVARYNPDGTLDSTFGAAGVAQISTGPGIEDIAHAVATQADGKVVVAGLANAGSIRRFGMARLITSTCGNGAREPAEQCDDGNLAIADSCDGLCRIEESVSTTVSAGGTVTSDSEADGATPTDGVETDITSPNPGAITILETSPTSPAVAGFELLSFAVNVTAPAATAAAPLAFTFRLDASTVPAGQDELGIAIFRNGALVPACAGATGEAAPDPCIASRAQLGDGDVAITVLSSQASRWEFAVATCTPRKAGVCRVPTSPGSGQLLLKRGTSPAGNRLVWKWSHGPGSLADLGDPTTSSDYVLCLIDQAGEIGIPLTAVPVGANGVCAGKPCWSVSGKNGFRYSDKHAASGGLRRLTMKSNKKGEANLNALAGGPGLELPALPLPLPVRVQLQRQDGACWEATYSEAHQSKNDADQFKGKAD
jgi:uncharacterized delta-60 repeat protein